MKVFFLDDEGIVIEELHDIINWQEHGCEIAGFAHNAADALKKIELCLPDILFLDISLPVMSGIEFAKIINARYPFIVIIILSAYKDFSYAQSAIESNVLTYLVKHELTPDVMVQTLKKAFVQSKKRRRDSYIIRAKIISDILGAGEDKSGIGDELHTHFSGYPPQFYTAVISVARQFTLNDTFLEDKFNFEREAFFSLSFNEFRVLDFFIQSNCVLLFLERKGKEANELNINSALHGELSKNVDALSKHHKRPLFAVYSYKVCTLSEIHRRFIMLRAHKNAYVFGGLVTTAVYNPPVQSAKPQSLQQRTYKELAELARRAIQENDAQQFFEIAIRFANMLKGSDANVSAVLNRPVYYADDILNELSTCLLAHEQKEKQNKSISPMVRFVLNSVEQGYKTPLKLSVISKQLNSNPMYVGQKFISEIGKPFHDYLTEYRLLRAKEMLATTNLKVFEVAQSVGISNSQYFSKVFKQFTGMGPLEYRQQEYKT